MKNWLLLITLFLGLEGFCGKKDTVLFSYGKEHVTVEEFKLVYEKNNLNKEDAYSITSLKEYLELYIRFKLKVADAIASGYDTVPAIKQEIEKYKGQLSKSYLNEKEITSNLIEEAYQRMQKEIHASHILIALPKNPTPEDTMAAYKKIMAIRKTAMKKEMDFGAMAKQHSQDPSAQKNRGDLGFFTAFQMVYAFETHAFKTPVGKISKPFRTRFGYHIMKVHAQRPNRGKIKVAHLFLKTPKNLSPDQAENVRKRIEDLYLKIEKGASFEKVVMQLSDDKASAKKGGELRWFGSGEMVKSFEDAAFALSEDGAISKPVRTDYGWHIIKRLEHKPLESFAELEKGIKKKITKDSRSNVAEEILINKIKKEHKYKVYPSGLKAFKMDVDSTILIGKWDGRSLGANDQKLFKMGKKVFTQQDLKSYILSARKIKKGKSIAAVVDYYYAAFERAICLNLAKAQLPYKYPEFRALMNEYNDGILLFEITDDKVWKKAVEDTSGLVNFYDQMIQKYFPVVKDTNGLSMFNKTYMWKDRIESNVFYCKTKKIADEVATELESYHDSTNSQLLALFNNDSLINLRVESGLFEKGSNKHVDETNWQLGISRPKELLDGQFLVVFNNSKIPPSPKAIDEVKGQVISQYQNALELDWILDLKKVYPVSINADLLKNLAQ